MKKIGLVFVFLLSISFQASAQWEWQNPYPTSNALYDVQFLNDSVVFCVGDGGFMMKSTDVGKTWENINSDTKLYLSKIYFIDTTNFLATGHKGTIIKSTDGGNSWHNVSNNIISGSYSDIDFVNNELGWISGQNGSHFGEILKTYDAGNTWEVVLSGSHTNFNSIKFFNADTGHVIDYYGLYSTFNGGATWSLLNLNYSGFRQMKFTSSSTGFIVGDNGLILKSTDNGFNWAKKNSGITKSIRSIDFNDVLNGIAVGVNGIILSTSNGGDNWNITSIPDDDFENLYSIDINYTGIALSAGIKGKLIMSSDLGQTWENKRLGYLNNMNSIYMLNNNLGWVVGDEGIALKTINGGENWSKIDSLTSVNLRDVFFSSDSIGWIVGDSGNVYNTVDGGSRWEKDEQFDNITFNSIFFINNEKGWLAGERGSIYYSSDGGYSWIQQQSNCSSNLTSVLFVDEYSGYIVGQNDTLLKTTNSGNTWEFMKIVYNNTSSISFVDVSTGWIAGGGTEYPNLDWGQICKTTDAGLSWDKFLFGYGTEWGFKFFDIHFLDRNRGWVFGRFLSPSGTQREGIIAYTMNGGENLIFQRTSTSNGLVSASIIEDSIIWVVGKNGTILRNSNAQIPTVVEDEINYYTPSNFLLQQNYPNPFNPSTSIQYAISSMQFVTLKVYDLLGRDVATLVNEEKPAGSYNVEFRMQNLELSSGIYFYQLRAGDPSSSSGQSFIETKKMILLK